LEGETNKVEVFHDSFSWIVDLAGDPKGYSEAFKYLSMAKNWMIGESVIASIKNFGVEICFMSKKA
jgi:hypothetical protein